MTTLNKSLNYLDEEPRDLELRAQKMDEKLLLKLLLEKISSKNYPTNNSKKSWMLKWRLQGKDHSELWVLKLLIEFYKLSFLLFGEMPEMTPPAYSIILLVLFSLFEI